MGGSSSSEREAEISVNAAHETKDRFSRIFDVLELLAAHSTGMTVTEVSKRLELPLSSTHNLLQRLVTADAVVVTEDLRYSIGGRAVRYGIRIIEGLEVRAIARQHLQDLARQVGEDVYLAERFGERVTYTDRITGHRDITIDIRLGQPLFLHATSVGKLFSTHYSDLCEKLLSGPRPQLTPKTRVTPAQIRAEIDKVRADGYAVSDGEAVPGIVGLAVPVYDARHQLVAAIHISALGTPANRAHQGEWLRLTAETAKAIERDLGRLPTHG